MTPKKESYLGADRSDPEEFFSAIERETSLLSEELARGGSVHAIDGIMVAHADADRLVSVAIAHWLHGERVPRHAIKRLRSATKDHERSFQENTGDNYRELQRFSHEENIGIMSHQSMNKASGILQPDWRVSGLEFWSRTALRNAFLGVTLDMLSKRGGRVTTPPDSRTLYQSLLRTAVASETLNNMYAHLLDHEPAHSRNRRHLESLQGLMLEYDALIALYEDSWAEDPSSVTYNIPSSPSLDFGAGNHPKVDLVSIYFKKGIPFDVGIDVKTKDRTQRSERAGKMILTAADIGCETVVDGKISCEYGRVAREFIDSHLSFNPHGAYTDPNYRMAVAIAAFGINLSEVIGTDES